MVSILAYVLLLSASAPAKGKAVGPYLQFDVHINGKPLQMILDTGAGLTCINPPVAEALQLQGGTPITARGVGSQRVNAKYHVVDEIRVGDAKISKAPIVAISLPPALQVDGIIGFNFFNAFVTTINYDQATLTLTKPEEFKPPKNAVKVPLRVRNNHAHIPIQVGDLEAWVRVDTGATESLTLFKSFVDKHDLRKKVAKIIPGSVSIGVGGASGSDMVYYDTIGIGGKTFKKPMISFATQSGDSSEEPGLDGNLGSEFLRRFTVTLDYQGKAAYFTPSKQFNSEYRNNRSGAGVLFNGKEYVVMMVRKDSPAEKAGLKVGDRITAINGKLCSKMGWMDVWLRFREKSGTQLNIALLRGEKSQNLTMVLADPS